MKNFFLIGGIVAVALIGWGYWAQHAGSNPDIIARNGLHWHAKLVIQEGTTTIAIPAGIGLTGGHSPMHTHDTDGVIHMEYDGMVYRKGLTLQHFFDVWGRSMDSFGTLKEMTVNGKPNTELGQYMMHDGDTIVLQYE